MGFEARQLPVKILYTLNRERTQKFVAKPANLLPVHAENATSTIGLLNVSDCLDIILKVCPELSEFSEYSDYSLYSVDYSESELPLLAHGLLSSHLNHTIPRSGQYVAGRIGRSGLYAQTLEIELCFTPLIKRKLAALQHGFESVPALPSDDILPAQAMKSMPISFSPNQKYASLREKHPVLPSSQAPPLPSSTSSRSHSDMPSVPSSDFALGAKRISPRKRFSASLFIPPSSPPRSISQSRPAPVPVPSRRTRGSRIDEQLSHAIALGEAPEFCHNCGDIRTSTWRKIVIDGKEHNLCNACGLYYKTKNVMRPSELFNRRSRTSKSLLSRTPTPNPIVLPSAVPSSEAVSEEPKDEPTPADATPDANELPNQPSSPGKPESSSEPAAPSTPDIESNKENIPPEARFLQLATPNKRPDQFAGGSGSARRWLRTHIFSRSDDDVFEAFMQSPSKRYSNQQAADFDFRVQKLYITSGPSISSSPPLYHLDENIEGSWFAENHESGT